MLRKFVSIIVASVGLTAGVLATGDLCIWESTTFPGSFQCKDEACGGGCGAPFNIKNHKACKPMSNGCCSCVWTTWTCDCTLGDGYGSDSTRTSHQGGTCEDDLCKLQPGTPGEPTEPAG